MPSKFFCNPLERGIRLKILIFFKKYSTYNSVFKNQNFLQCNECWSIRVPSLITVPFRISWLAAVLFLTSIFSTLFNNKVYTRSLDWQNTFNTEFCIFLASTQYSIHFLCLKNNGKSVLNSGSTELNYGLSHRKLTKLWAKENLHLIYLGNF